MLAHGGAAGAAIELAVFVVPMLVFGFLWWWAARRSDGRDDAETEGERPGP